MRKHPTGIPGLDEVTGGGLPAGRTTLLCGGPGTGKSLLALSFLVAGARDHDEPGLFVSFETDATQIAADAEGLGFDVPELQASGKLTIEHIRVAPSDLRKAGQFDLEPLFVRLGEAIEQSRAQRVALDTAEALFAGFDDADLIRREIGRLFGWLKDRGVSTVVTTEAETSEGLSRHGLEEFVSDCVIRLDNRVREGTSTRRLRIVKYRGSAHGTDEYPFMIDVDGFSVHPLTSLGLDHEASTERISSGVERLDEMLSGGYYKGTTVLVTGQPGSGKSSLAASFARTACERGERAVYFALEESAAQIRRNMASIGIDLAPHVESGALTMITRRSTSTGLESHLAAIQNGIRSHAPDAVVIDPVSSLDGSRAELESTLTRLIDFLKVRGITTMLTMLVHEDAISGAVGVSSLSDTWLRLTNVELAGERNRGISIFKSRGMAHSNQVREFVLSSDGIDIVDAYAGEDGLLMGAARRDAEVRAQAERVRLTAALDLQRMQVDARRATIAAQIAALQAELASAEQELEDEATRQGQLVEDASARGSRREHGRRSDGSG